MSRHHSMTVAQVIDDACLALQKIARATEKDGHFADRVELTIRVDGRVEIVFRNAAYHVGKTIHADLLEGGPLPTPSEALRKDMTP